MFTDILESTRLSGMVSVCDRLVPVVSALDHDHHHDHHDHDHYHSDNSEGVSSVSCRSDRSESPERGTQTGGDTDNEEVVEVEDSEDNEEEKGKEDEEESSPGTGRSSPAAQATPNSAMSISPANSEVGSRLIQNLGGSASSQTSSTSSLPRQANTPYVPKKRYEWGKARKNVPDRADLDTNWRQSASGPASDKSSTSSTSSGEREVVTSSSTASSSPRTPAEVQRRPEASVKRQDSINSENRESRADLDSNWRDHITTTLPPSGAKTGKFKNKNQKHLEQKGMNEGTIL